MIIIIGLGNPGEKFENTRHNVGFMAVDMFAGKNNFPAFELNKKYNALISKNIVNQKEILLIKPQTFMNDSGKSVKKIVSNIKDQIENIAVVHDDIDLSVGKIKIIRERGSAGHKGVESIIKNIGNDNLIRFRIGIGQENKAEAIKIVLKNFSAEEKEKTGRAINNTVSAIDLFINEGLDKSMNKYN